MAQSAPADLRPEARPKDFSHEQHGYRQGLSRRQINMIALGGAIGTGLFLGAGGRLASAGPSLFIVYAVCGAVAYIILRALGELVVHRPASGSFVSYAREFFGERTAFVAGWMYVLVWGMAAIAEITAAAIYMQYWAAFTTVPQWAMSLIALVAVLSINVISVRFFGELEFWFALIKVGAIVGFLTIGAIALAWGFPLEADGGTVTPGLSLWADHGGLLPNGLMPAVVVSVGVVFAYAGLEVIGTTAGETKNPAIVIPRAVNTLIFRIAVFYVGSVLLLSLLLPYTAYEAGESPFVTFFTALGNSQIGRIGGGVMNFVVITAALSALNAGLYTSARVLRSMAANGAAPRFTNVMSKNGVPVGGVLFTAGIAVLGVFLNMVVPADAFEIVLNMTALGILSSWAMILLCQIRLRRASLAGVLDRPAYRLPGAPCTAWVALAFLAGVAVMMTLDYPTGTMTMATFVVVGIPALVVGWFCVRGRVRANAEEHLTQTREFGRRIHDGL